MRNELTRREVMSYAAVGAAGLLLPAASEAEILSCIKYVARLQPTRFIAGLIFDIGKAVVVDMASDAIVKGLSRQHYSYSGIADLGYSVGTSRSLSAVADESNFKPVPYKASVITLGIADYELHPQRTFKMKLTSEAEKRRFQTVLGYLQEQKIKIKIADMGYAIPANEFSGLEPDDLLTLERWHLEEDQEAHVKALIAETKVSAFDDLMA